MKPQIEQEFKFFKQMAAPQIWMQTEQSCKDKEGPDEKQTQEIENQEITDDELLGRTKRMIKTVKSQMGIQNGSIN